MRITAPQIARAQGQDKGTGAQAEYDSGSRLSQEIEALVRSQQQIINDLNELKRLLQNNVAVQPAPQVPLQPTNLTVQGEAFRGESGAQTAIVEYADFECPYCGQFERTTFQRLLSDYIATGKVKYFYRDLPLPMHAHAMPAARAARCAGEQGKYWEMHDSLFAKQTALSGPAVLDRADSLGLDKAKFTECLSSDRYTADIQKNLWDAQQMGIDGTPTFYVGAIGPNGDVIIDKLFRGTAPFDVFKSDPPRLTNL